MFEGTDSVLNIESDQFLQTFLTNLSKHRIYTRKIPTVDHRKFDSVNQP